MLMEELLNCKTVNEAVKFIFDNKNTGNEQNFLDTVFFGMGVYVYTEDVLNLGLKIEHSKNPLFAYVNEEQCKTLLNSLNIFQQ